MKAAGTGKLNRPLRAWDQNWENGPQSKPKRVPSAPGPLDNLPPLTSAAVMRAGQGLGWTEVVDLCADLERRIARIRTNRGWQQLTRALPARMRVLDNILTRPARRRPASQNKPKAANRRAKR